MGRKRLKERKYELMKELKVTHEVDVFVETGTYQGDTLRLAQKDFKFCHSIELSDRYYKDAVKKFNQQIEDKKTFIYHGDSSKILKDVIQPIEEKIVFFLDGHYSGGGTAKGDNECPLKEELAAIKEHKIKDHVIIIDDARHFNGNAEDVGYIEAKRIEEILKDINPDYQLEMNFELDLFYAVVKK